MKRINYYTFCKIPKNQLPGVEGHATPEQIENAIGEVFHRQFDDRVLSIEYRDGELTFIMPLRNGQEGSAAGIKAVDDKILELLNDYYKDIITKPLKLREDFVAIYDAIPPFKVVHDNIALNFSISGDKENSFHDIHKAIDTKDLRICVHSSHKITSSVLGLLKMPRLQNLMYIMDPVPEWFNIVHKHFEGEKDLVACQRELIEKDLDEYAEL